MEEILESSLVRGGYPTPENRRLRLPEWMRVKFASGEKFPVVIGRPSDPGYVPLECYFKRRFENYLQYLRAVSGLDADASPEACSRIVGGYYEDGASFFVNGPFNKKWVDLPYEESLWVKGEGDPIYSEFLPVLKIGDFDAYKKSLTMKVEKELENL